MSTQKNTIKGYHLNKPIGEGGFGRVFVATQPGIQREVAIKIIKPKVASQPEFIRRFETEAQLIARLEHPHITPLYDYWRDADGAYLVMRYLKGGSLRDWLRKDGALALHTISTILDQLAAALDFAHRQQVIHRDIKPDNILLDEEGNIYLADFGIAKDLTMSNSQTSPEAVVGSLDYISPEQARSEPVTGRTDIYSLGVVLYELLSGKHPFAEVSMVERLYKHINDPLPDILLSAQVSDMVRDTINAIVQRATQKDPTLRYADVMSMAVAFREAIGRGDTEEALDIEAQLTMREHEVLTLLATGITNREIADSLFISHSGVKFHLRNIYKKLGVSTRVQAIIRARELDLITTELVADALPADIKAISNMSVALPDPENPYKGLLAFQVTDARDFFGRDDLSDKLVRSLAEDTAYKRFLAIVGPSGSGKSSLARAGIIPRIRKGELLPSKTWFIADFLPGERPLDALEIALEHVAANHISNVREHLERDAHGLVRVADLILPKDDSQLVLVIDQFEEIFTQVADEATRQHLLDLIYTAVTAQRSRVYVLLTLRADYYDRPLHYPQFGEMLRARMTTILPLSAQGLERAIAGPAERVAVRFETGLVAQIVSEMNYQAGALPLLQYALTELFERREDRLLTREAYRAIGGAVGALAQRAEDIYAQHTASEQALIRQLFLRLVTLGEGAEDTRRRTTLRELLSITDQSDLLEEIIDQFADHRLLSLDQDEETRQPTVEVAHEAILREWERLRGWLNDSREDIRQQRILAHAADEWDSNQRVQGFLWTQERLTQAETWADNTRLNLTPLEQQFIAASLTQRENQEKAEAERRAREAAQETRSRNLLRALVAVFALAALISGSFGVVAFQQRDQAVDAQADTLEALDIAQRSALAFAANSAIAIEDIDIAIALAVQSAQGGDELLPETFTVLERIANNAGLRTWFDADAFNCSGNISQDGRYVVLTNCRDTAQIYDVFSGELIQTLGGNGDETMGNRISGVFLTRDSQYLIALSYNGRITVYNLVTGERIQQFEAQGTVVWIHQLAEQPIIATSIIDSDQLENDVESFSNNIRLFDLFTGELVRDYTFEDTQFIAFNFSLDGSLGITGGWADPDTKAQYEVNVFDAETGEIIETYVRDHIGTVNDPHLGAAGVGFSPDNARIWFGGSPNYVIDRTTGETLYTIEADRILRITDDFQDVVVNYSDAGSYDFRLISLDDGSTITELPDFDGAWRSIPDSDLLLAGKRGQPGVRQLWDIHGRTTNQTTLLDSAYWTNTAVDDVSGNIAIVNMGYGLQVWNPEGTNLVFEDMRIGQPGSATAYTGTSVAWSPDGRYLATGMTEEGMYVYDTATWQIHRHFTDIEQWWLGPTQFTSDGQFLLGTVYSWHPGLFYDVSPFIVMWDIETGELVKRIEFPDEDVHWGVIDLEVHPTRNIAYVAISDTYTTNRGFIADLDNGTVVQEIILDQLPADGTFSHDGNHLIVGGFEGTLYVLDATTYEIERQWQTLDADVWGVDLSPDDRYLATGSGFTSSGAFVSLWDFETGEILRRYIGPNSQFFIVDMDFSADSNHLISTSEEVIMWEVDTQTDLEWILENRAVRELTCAERRVYRVEPLCESEEP